MKCEYDLVRATSRVADDPGLLRRDVPRVLPGVLHAGRPDRGAGRRQAAAGGRTDPPPRGVQPRQAVPGARSEEHTSELQSRGHLVCRLRLENKKRIPRTYT